MSDPGRTPRASLGHGRGGEQVRPCGAHARDVVQDLGGVLAAVRRGGTVVQVGNLPAGPVPAELAALVFREIDYRGTFRFANELDDALAYLADGLDVEPLLTHTFDAGDVAEAFAVASDRGTGSSKVLLKFV
ncbi:hypothetical protein NG697_06520 [Pseudarthrobacter sp. MDT3-26]|uniref:hypothetical protein n=1 Tax=Pseudarthrobacter raffinosi TaxID=2953651 RepID=UPI00208EA0AE|nr:hypothetical protein [Pseudarthrobacter sp. MDT3-26]MCO4262582.1 hypothetical protein [Pseudarthrobacter sp. MDT3-26]